MGRPLQGKSAAATGVDDAQITFASHTLLVFRASTAEDMSPAVTQRVESILDRVWAEVRAAGRETAEAQAARIAAIRELAEEIALPEGRADRCRELRWIA